MKYIDIRYSYNNYGFGLDTRDESYRKIEFNLWHRTWKRIYVYVVRTIDEDIKMEIHLTEL